MYKELTRDKKGSVLNQVSMFQPSDEVKKITQQVLTDYQLGTEVLRRGRPEFNDRSVLEEIDVNQRAFNSYVPPRTEDPDESWRAQTVRPVTRNKLIGIAAHVTATMLFPNVFAQNESDEEDKDAAIVMRDLVEWVIENSNYPKSFLNAVIAALVDPVAIVQEEFAEVMRTIKDLQENGKYTLKQIVDEVLSGFQIHLVRANQLLIPNFYEAEIQKQRFLIREKKVDYEEAKQVYGNHKNFKFVSPGVKCVWDEMTKTFYDVEDKATTDMLVSEITYYNRAQDLQLCFLNGILVTDPDRPLQRRDKKYPFAKTGYEPINNGQCFYYKSAANKLGSDQQLVDTLYNMILDGTFLQLMPPMAVYGSEEVSSGVFVPGTVTGFRDPNVKMESIGPRSDIRAGLETIAIVERSMSESSQDALRSGLVQGGERTARESMLIEKNAQIAMGLFGKMIGFLVEDLGRLIVGDILQHMTVGEVDKISNEMKFKSFLLSEKPIDGRKVSKKIKFTDEYIGKEEMGESEYLGKSFDLLEEEGGMDGEMKIYLVNPDKFRNEKYFIKVNVDEMYKKSKALEKALNLELYDRAIANPTVDIPLVTKDFLFETYKPGESSKYVKKPVPQNASPELENGVINQKGVNQNLVGQLTGSNSLGVAASTEE